MRSSETTLTRRGSVRALAKFAGGPKRIRRRPRTDDDRVMIHRMAMLEVARRVAEGRLVRLGPREYEVHLRTASGASANGTSPPA